MGLDNRVHFTRKKSFRTRSNRVKLVRTPGNKLVYHYLSKKVKSVSNPKFLGGAALPGIRQLRAPQKKNAKKNEKSVSRAYGGVLSHDLVRERIVRAFLIEEQKIVKRVLKQKKK
jgi:large subunit ribosomal protein L34e